MAKTVKQLVEQFNIKVATNFMKKYEQLEPELMGIAFEFRSGMTEKTTFPISKFLNELRKLNGGNIIYQSPADTFQFEVKNYEYGNGVEIPLIDFERAGASENLLRLNPYQWQIDSMVTEGREHPYEEALDYVLNGAATTYGTCFDGQALYSNTHDFNDAAGTQDNLLTGTGVTIDKLHADMLEAWSALNGFTFDITDGAGVVHKRKLNAKMKISDLLVIVPSELSGIFAQLSSQKMISDGTTSIDNIFVGLKVVSRPMSDVNDFYVFNTNDNGQGLRPVLISVEKPLEVRVPRPTDDALKQNNKLKYGVYDSHGLGYGAWWKTCKIVNA